MTSSYAISKTLPKSASGLFSAILNLTRILMKAALISVVFGPDDEVVVLLEPCGVRTGAYP